MFENSKKMAKLAMEALEDKKAEEEAKKDSLTHIYNAYTTRKLAESYIKESAELSATLLIIDLDDFKQVNDQYGHLFGDAGSGYNIGNLRLSRTRREGDVITVVETDVPVDDTTVGQLRSVESVSEAVVIPHF